MRRFASLSLSLVASGGLAAQDFREFRAAGLVPALDLDWRAVAAADLDGDGDLDLVFANHGTPGVGQRNLWMRNDGTGLFERMPDTALRLAPSLSHAVLLADFDRDGDVDAFFGNQRLDAICRNDGQGELALAPGDLPGLDRTTYAAAAGDIDGDGDLDIVAACGGTDIVYVNDGTGRFADGSHLLPVAWDKTVALALSDFDGDGDLDLLRANEDTASQLLVNDGAGRFVATGLALPQAVFVTAGDVDRDGLQDFVLGVHVPPSGPFPSTYRTVLHRSRGGLAFETTTLPRLTERAIHPAHLVDLDRDGDLDLAVAGDRVLLNDGRGVFTAGDAQPWIGTAFADVDGDGDLDLLGIPTLRNDGTGRFPRPEHLPALLEGDRSRVVAMFDFDRDGDLDLVREADSRLEVLGNDGRGAFRGVIAGAANVLSTGEPWTAADWTGDGYADLLEGYTGTLFENVAGRGFAVRRLPEAPNRFLTFDGDGDGDLDLLGQRSGGALAWFANQGGGFGAGTTLALGQFSGLLAVADLDGDGRQDAIVVGLGGEAVALRCTGIGVFARILDAFPAGLPAVSAAFASDLDGDGDADCVLGHDYRALAQPRMSVLRNDGTGRFALATTAFPPSGIASVTGILGADFDEDGDVDLVVHGSIYGGQDLRLFRNDGALAFADATGSGEPWLGLPRTPGYALPGDVDGDGDVDLVVGRSGESAILQNLQRQLVIDADPAVGTNWRISVVQRPIGAAVGGLLVGPAELVPARITPWGRLRVDLAVGSVLGFVPVAQAAPVTVVTLPVPALPALRGVRVFVQNVAFDGQAVRLGNQLRATVR